MECYNYLNSFLTIQVTDAAEVKWNAGNRYNDGAIIGQITGFPVVSTVSLTDSYYKLQDGEYTMDIICSETQHSDTTIVKTLRMLCPLNGLDNIQLEADVKDAQGNRITTTQLPKFSVRRGKATILKGPLFSGSTADWTITME